MMNVVLLLLWRLVLIEAADLQFHNLQVNWTEPTVYRSLLSIRFLLKEQGSPGYILASSLSVDLFKKENQQSTFEFVDTVYLDVDGQPGEDDYTEGDIKITNSPEGPVHHVENFPLSRYTREQPAGTPYKLNIQAQDGRSQATDVREFLFHSKPRTPRNEKIHASLSKLYFTYEMSDYYESMQVLVQMQQSSAVDEISVETYMFNDVQDNSVLVINKTYFDYHWTRFYLQALSGDQESGFGNTLSLDSDWREKVFSMVLITLRQMSNQTLEWTVKTKLNNLSSDGGLKEINLSIVQFIKVSETLEMHSTNLTISASSVRARELESYHVEYEHEQNIRDVIPGTKYQVLASFTALSGQVSPMNQSNIVFTAPSPLQGVEPIYRFPHVGFTHQPDNQSRYDQLLVSVSMRSTGNASQFYLNRKYTYKYIIRRQSFRTSRDVKVWTVSNNVSSLSSADFLYDTGFITIEEPEIKQIPSNKSVQLLITYTARNFAYAEVQFKAGDPSRSTTVQIAKNSEPIISIANFTVGVYRVGVNAINGERISFGQKRHLHINPSPPRNAQIVNITKSQVTISWEAPKTPYHKTLIRCTQRNICPSLNVTTIENNTYRYTSNDDLPGGNEIEFELRSTYIDGLEELRSEPVKITAAMDTENLQEFSASYVEVENTSEIHHTNFSVKFVAKPQTAVSKVFLQLKHIDELRTSTKLILEQEYLGSTFLNEQLEAILNPDQNVSEIQHPVPGSLYKFEIVVHGLPGKSTYESEEIVRIPPHPPFYFAMISQPTAANLSFAWLLSPSSLQDKLIMKRCSMSNELECFDDLMLDPTATTYETPNNLSFGIYVIYLLAQSHDLNSSASSKVIFNPGGACTHPNEINGDLIGDKGEKPTFYKSGHEYKIECHNGFYTLKTKKLWSCEQKKWRRGPKCIAVNKQFIFTTSLFGSTAVALIATVGGVVWYSLCRKKKRRVPVESLNLRQIPPIPTQPRQPSHHDSYQQISTAQQYYYQPMPSLGLSKTSMRQSRLKPN